MENRPNYQEKYARLMQQYGRNDPVEESSNVGIDYATKYRDLTNKYLGERPVKNFVRPPVPQPKTDAELAAEQASESPFTSTVKSTGAHMLNSFLGQPVEDIGRAIGSKPLASFGQGVREYSEGVQEANPSPIQRLSDIAEHPWDATKVAVANAGTQLPVGIASSLAGAKLGAQLPVPTRLKPAAVTAGALTGVFAPSFLQEYAETRGIQHRTGKEDIGKASQAAVGSAGLETLQNISLFGRILPPGLSKLIPDAITDKGLKEGASRIGYAAAQSLKAAVSGAGTEYGQTALEQWGGGQDLSTEESGEERLVSAALGAIGEGVIRGGLALVEGRVKSDESKDGSENIQETDKPETNKPSQGAISPQADAEEIQGYDITDQESTEAQQAKSDISDLSIQELYQEQASIKELLVNLRIEEKNNPSEDKKKNISDIQQLANEIDQAIQGISKEDAQKIAEQKEWIKENISEGDTVSHPTLGESVVTELGRDRISLQSKDGQSFARVPYETITPLNDESKEPKNEVKQESKSKSEKKQKDSFAPTHTTSDGEQVVQIGENLYQDREGNEIEDSYADPISSEEVDQQTKEPKPKESSDVTQEQLDAGMDTKRFEIVPGPEEQKIIDIIEKAKSDNTGNINGYLRGRLGPEKFKEIKESGLLDRVLNKFESKPDQEIKPQKEEIKTQKEEIKTQEEEIKTQEGEVEGLKLTSKGTPFKTKKSAKTAKNNALKTSKKRYEVVPHGDGFALKPVTSINQQASEVNTNEGHETKGQGQETLQVKGKDGYKNQVVPKDPSKAQPDSKIRHSFKGDSIESFVVENNDGKRFNVSVRDTESGEFFPTTTIFDNEEDAIKKAKDIVNGSSSKRSDPINRLEQLLKSPITSKDDPKVITETDEGRSLLSEAISMMKKSRKGEKVNSRDILSALDRASRKFYKQLPALSEVIDQVYEQEKNLQNPQNPQKNSLEELENILQENKKNEKKLGVKGVEGKKKAVENEDADNLTATNQSLNGLRELLENLKSKRANHIRSERNKGKVPVLDDRLEEQIRKVERILKEYDGPELPESRSKFIRDLNRKGVAVDDNGNTFKIQQSPGNDNGYIIEKTEDGVRVTYGDPVRGYFLGEAIERAIQKAYFKPTEGVDGEQSSKTKTTETQEKEIQSKSGEKIDKGSTIESSKGIESGIGKRSRTKKSEVPPGDSVNKEGVQESAPLKDASRPQKTQFAPPKDASRPQGVQQENTQGNKPKVSKNTIVTDDTAEKYREILRRNRSQLNAGIDPETLQAGIGLSIYHIERGARTFAAYAKAMLNDLNDIAESIKPHLGSWYMAAKLNPDIKKAGINLEMDTEELVSNFNFDQEEQPAKKGIGLKEAKAFAERLLNGESFKTIIQARKAITDQKVEPGTLEAKQADEAIEFAGVIAARKIVAKKMSDEETFDALVELADRLPKLSVRTSTSVSQQAYSTPLPLAWVASVRAGINEDMSVLEPTAGNGALVIGAKPEHTMVNELNPDRVDNLKNQGFEPYQEDASTFDFGVGSDVVIANPPFGVIRDENGNTITHKINDRYETNEIDHAISFNSLKAMKDDGRSVLIVGGPNKTLSDEGRSNAYNAKAKRSFYFTLYNEYNVVDHFTVSGDLYAKQGAAWPVDVIVIEGRGKSSLELPAVNLPRIINSIEELKNELSVRKPDLQQTRETNRTEAKSRTTSDHGLGGRNVTGNRPGGTIKNGKPESVLSGSKGIVEPSDKKPVSAGTNRKVDQGSGKRGRSDRKNSEIKNSFQSEYIPSSKSRSVGTLVPVNMRSAIESALKKLKERNVDIDSYVGNKLQYTEDEVSKYFSAEQVDAIALAIDNIENGKGFIIGDQTGVGKGRVNAAMIRYGMLNGLTPVFVTKRDNLYSDMMRDLRNIGMPDAKPFATNASAEIGLDQEAIEWMEESERAKSLGLPTPKRTGKFIKNSGQKKHGELMEKMINEGNIGEYDVIFTTYSQMQTVQGVPTKRMEFLSRFANKGLLILDESHSAGGTETSGRGKKSSEEGKIGRAGFTRKLVNSSAGTFYSSATYAKRPDVLDLYSKTDMGLVANPKELKNALQSGGVALQQVVASMLAKTGQYIRREKSFDGIEYRTSLVPVNTQFSEDASEIMRMIMVFDQMKSRVVRGLNNTLKSQAKRAGVDGAIGSAGASSTNFTSLMHNVVSQMLLMLKVQPTINEALEALKRGEKPVIALSNTMGSFIDENAKDLGLNPGDPIILNFGDLLKRYLIRSRRVTIGDPYGKKESRPLLDEELGPGAVNFYEKISERIDEMDFSEMKISPIDAIHHALREAGYKTGEITGRNSTIDYSLETPVYKRRNSKDTSPSGIRKTINDFNDGKIDVIILNQSGATGLSLHSSKDEGSDTRKRHMIITQAELNIDTHMQMLGRINRTGQEVLPSYSQLVADIPAEKRPAAILAKKMAMLNANTTAGKDSAVKAKDVPDFLNEYGDDIAAQVMEDFREFHNKLGSPLSASKKSDGRMFDSDGAMRKVTGRIPVLSLKDQEELYSIIEEAYNEYIQMLDSTGQNMLNASELDLDAKTIKSEEFIKPISNQNSPFAEGVTAETVDVKKLGKPHSIDKIQELVLKDVGIKESGEIRTYINDLMNQLEKEYENKVAEINSLFDEALEESEDIEKQKDNITRRKEGRLQSLEIQKNKLAREIETLLPGRPVLMTSANGTEYYGYVGVVSRKGKSENFFARSQWKAKIYVADAAKQLTIPLSKIALDSVGQDVSLGMWGIEKSDSKTVNEVFESGISETREQRIILTGNLLAAYTEGGSGQIVNYTTSNGEVKQGILTSKKFEVEKAKNSIPARFLDANIASRFIQQGFDPKYSIRTTDGFARIISQNSGSYTLFTDRSKANGGRYFTNKRLVELLGDFVLSGSTMRVDIPSGKLDSAVRIIHAIGEGTEAISREEGSKFIESNENGTRLSATPKSEKKEQSLPFSQVKEKANQIFSKLRIDPSLKLEVVENESAITNKKIQEQIELQGAEGQVIGVYDGNGSIVIVASNIKNLAELEEAILHEALGHYGARRLFGKGVGQEFQKLYDAFGGVKGIKEIAEKNGINMRDYFAYAATLSPQNRALFLVDELLAHLQGRKAYQTLSQKMKNALKEFFGAIRNWMRAHRMLKSAEMSDSDIAYLLSRLSKATRKGRGFKRGEVRLHSAWHGSPHNFNKFDIKNIGRGEGAQVFGHGLYFSSKKEIAEWYRNSLSNKTFLIDDEEYEYGGLGYFHKINFDPDIEDSYYISEDDDYDADNSYYYALDALWNEGNKERAISYLENKKNEFEEDSDERDWYENAIDFITEGSVKTKYNGKLYQVELAPKEDEYLLWDKPFYKQSEKVKKALKSDLLLVKGKPFVTDGMTGKEIYRWFGDDKFSSYSFKKAGIKGIKYLDNSSRYKGEGSYNYVIFDDQDITITAKFSLRQRKDAQMEALKKSGMIKEKDDRSLFDKARDLITELSHNWNTVGKDRIREGLFDRFHGIYAAERDLLGGIVAELSGYISSRFSTGISSLVYGMLLKGAPTWNASTSRIEMVEESKGLIDIFNRAGSGTVTLLDGKTKISNLDAFFGWMIGNRAQRLMKEGRENNFSKDHIRELIALGDGQEDLFKSIRDEYNEYKKNVLDVAEKAGLIDSKSRKMWDQGDYIPFYRVIDDDGKTKAPFNKKGFSHQTSGIRRLKGGKSALGDPLENIVRNFTHLMDASLKNNAIRKVINNFDGTGIIEEIPRIQFKKALIPMGQFKKILIQSEFDNLVKEGLSPALAQEQAEEIVGNLSQDVLEGFREVWSIAPPSDPDVVRVMDDGKTYYYRVLDEGLLRGLTAINYENNNAALRLMRGFKRMLTTGVTVDPTFMVRNFIRDAGHAWVINNDGFKFGVDSIRGAIKSINESGGAIDMMFSGSSFIGGYINGNDPEAVASAIKRALRKKGYNDGQINSYMKKVALTSGEIWERYRHFGDKIENANREAVYEAALRAGKSKTQAVFEAKDLMDYSMHGNFQLIQIMADVLPFFNARLQGLYKIGRSGALKGHVLQRGMYLAAFSLALLALNWKDKRYEELEDWDKDMNWHFFLWDQHIIVPKPFEVGLLFGSVPERMTRNLLGRDETKESAERMLWMFGEVFAMNPIPQIVKPGLEAAWNKNTFTHRPIEGMADERKLPSARYNEYTSDFARAISGEVGDAIHLGPKKIEHLVRGYFGTLGSYVLMMGDVSVRLWNNSNPIKTSITPDDIPALRAFYKGSEIPHNTKYRTKLYDMAKEVSQVHNTIQAKLKEGDSESAARLKKENFEILKYRKKLESGTKNLSSIRKRIDKIYRNPVLSPSERKKQIDILTKQGNESAEKIVESIPDGVF